MWLLSKEKIMLKFLSVIMKTGGLFVVVFAPHNYMVFGVISMLISWYLLDFYYTKKLSIK
jgi:hypothetical protein